MLTLHYLILGETLVGGIQQSYLLQDDQALILSAIDEFTDNSEKGKSTYVNKKSIVKSLILSIYLFICLFGEDGQILIYN